MVSRTLEQRNKDLAAIATNITNLGPRRLRVRYTFCNGKRVAIYGYQFDGRTGRSFAQISKAKTSGETTGKVISFRNINKTLNISSTIADLLLDESFFKLETMIGTRMDAMITRFVEGLWASCGQAH